MASYWTGANTYFVIGKEATMAAGPPATPVGHRLRVERVTCSMKQAEIANNDLRSDPSPAQSEEGMQTVNLQVVTKVNADEFGLLCYFFFGTYSAAASSTAPCLNTFKIGSTLPPSCWVNVGDTAVGKYDVIKGCRINSISLGAVRKQDQYLTATIGFTCVGDWERNNASAEDASPATYNCRQHTMIGTSVEVATVETTLIDEISYGISRNATPYAPLNGDAFATDIDLGQYTFDFTMSGWRDAADTLYAYSDGTERVIEIISPQPGAPTYYVNFTHSECTVFASEEQGEVTNAPVPVKMRVRPYKDNHADASAVKVLVASSVNDYSAIV